VPKLGTSQDNNKVLQYPWKSYRYAGQIQLSPAFPNEPPGKAPLGDVLKTASAPGIDAGATGQMRQSVPRQRRGHHSRGIEEPLRA
jgi:hypothetical protein